MDRSNLLKWFHRNKRDFPWRTEKTPYKVLVSEIMLQQTQASVVIPYFERWMSAFPTLSTLALAEESVVLKLWEGLGYYSRARNLHKLAKECHEKYQGTIPSDPELLQKLKGIGPYTLGALLSFAFEQKAVAIDANVARVLARHFLVEEEITTALAKKKIHLYAENHLPEEKPWEFNEALIELGALICKKKPQCVKCPLNTHCLAYKRGVAETLPLKKKRAQTEHIKRAVILLSYEDQLLVQKGEKGKVMEGLLHFPFLDWQKNFVETSYVIQQVEERFAVKVNYIEHREPVTHSFTKYQVELVPIRLTTLTYFEKEPFFWQTHKELQEQAFCSGHKALLNILTKLSE